MQYMKKAGLLMLGLLVLVLAGCTASSPHIQQDIEYTNRVMEQYNTAQPPHYYDASQARENLIASQDALALGADSWTIQHVEGVGTTFECASVGFPLPFGSQLTMPEAPMRVHEGSERHVLSQIEPYGVYPPSDVVATMGNCVLPSGEVGIFYSEAPLTTYMFDVLCEEGICTVAEDAASSVEVTRVDPEDVNVQEVDPNELTSSED